MTGKDNEPMDVLEDLTQSKDDNIDKLAAEHTNKKIKQLSAEVKKLALLVEDLKKENEKLRQKVLENGI